MIGLTLYVQNSNSENIFTSPEISQALSSYTYMIPPSTIKNGLWAQYESSIVSEIKTNTDMYKEIRPRIAANSSIYFSDATITKDIADTQGQNIKMIINNQQNDVSFFWGDNKANVVSTAIVYQKTILNKYKDTVNTISDEIRAPATTSVRKFRDMYRTLTNCIPPGIESNAAYAPTVAANRDAETDLTAIGTTLNKTTLDNYISRYTAAIISAYNTLRADQLVFLQNYKAIYDAYFNIQNSFPSFVKLPTLDISDNGGIAISSFPAATTTIPSDANITALAATCNKYNGEQGLFAKLLSHIQTNATATFVEFERLYSPMPQFIKNIIQYASPLDSTGNLSGSTVGSALADLKTNYDLLAGVFMASAYGIYMAYRQFLSAADVTAAMTTYAVKCEAYQPQTTFALLTGDTYDSLIRDGVAFINAFSGALVGRFRTVFNLMNSRGLSTSGVSLPETIDQDVGIQGTEAWSVIERYGGLFEQLVGRLQTAVAAKIDQAAVVSAVRTATSGVVNAVGTGSEGARNAMANLRNTLAPSTSGVAGAVSRGAAAISNVSSKAASASKGFATVPTVSGSASGASKVAAIAASASKNKVSNIPPSASRSQAASGGQGGSAGGGQGASGGQGGSAGGGQGASGGQGNAGGGQGAAGGQGSAVR
jgi:hypothetical protein